MKSGANPGSYLSTDVQKPVVRSLVAHWRVVHLLPMMSVPAALAFHYFIVPVTAFDVSLFWAMWFVVGCLGITTGYHRHYTHRSFTAVRPLRIVMGLAGSMAGQGPLIYWVALHRLHHQNSDTLDDPHSPNINRDSARGIFRAFVRGHLGWVKDHQTPSLRKLAPDLLRDNIAVWVNDQYRLAMTLGLLLPMLAGFLWYHRLSGAIAGLLWGGFLRLCIGNQIVWAVNSVGHRWGRTAYNTGDFSRNNALLALLSWGEGWHNNHHMNPASASLGHRWWQVDFGFILIRLLKKFRLVESVRLPSRFTV